MTFSVRGTNRSCVIPALLRRRAVLGLVLACGVALVGCSNGDSGTSFHGAKLGMAPRDVRDRFDLAALGAFKITSPGDELVLDWAPSRTGEGTVESARFEFHAGMLVAVRARLAQRDPEAAGSPLLATKTAVVARTRAEGVGYTLLARDCPTHRDEEKRLLQQGP